MTMTMSAPQQQTATPRKIFKVLCPIERKDGGTHWIRIGTAFPNRDQSINVYLDVLPANQKLQVREMDEEDLREKDPTSPRRRGERPGGGKAGNEDLPF